MDRGIPSVNIAARVNHTHFKSTSTTHDRPRACHQAPRGGFCTTSELDVLFVRATVLLASAGRDGQGEGLGLDLGATVPPAAPGKDPL